MNLIVAYRCRFKITYTLARMLEILAQGESVSIAALATEICISYPSQQSVKAQMCRLRKAIAPIEIRTIRNCYRLEEPHLSALRGEP